MLRLHSESSRPYPGRSVSHAVEYTVITPGLDFTGQPRSRHHRLLSTVMSPLWKHKQWAANYSEILTAPGRVTCQVMRQKSAAAILAKCRG